MKKKIAWVTADYFLDCDIDIISELGADYNIDWNIVLPIRNSRFSRNQIEEKNSLKNINKVFWIEKYRLRDFKNILFYWKMFRGISRQNPDIIYINFQGFPYLVFLCFFLLDRKKTLFAVHQAQVHEGMKFKKITTLYFKFQYSWFTNFHLYSKTQTVVFKQKCQINKRVFTIPLGLKDFGNSSKKPSNDKTVFFNFGTIIKNKNIGLLIKAACNIHDRGYNNFIIKLVGACENWEEYEKLIRIPEIFELKKGAIGNDEIPDLFCSSHFLVLPYSSVSQSGPLKIAFNYNVPVIASDLDEFKNEIIDCETGFLFENNNIRSLEEILIQAIGSSNTQYKQMKRNQQADVSRRYSKLSIVDGYRKMFNSILK